MSIINNLKETILHGGAIDKQQALSLLNVDLAELCKSANEIRTFCCGSICDFCTIINAKSGVCSENCAFCTQSAHYNTNVKVYGLMGTEAIAEEINYNEQRNITKCGLVTSGKKLSSTELDSICKSVSDIKKTSKMSICASAGLLNEQEYTLLKDNGIIRVHNNLETSRSFFDKICTTHSFEDKVTAIKTAQSVGLKVCSGGIIGLGETMLDRIEMAFELRDLGIKSVPINILQAMKGTPLENNPPLSYEEALRVVAIFRFILPTAIIRLAGGRSLFEDKGKAFFMSGANGAITGDMLTTTGTTIESDIAMVESLGFTVAKYSAMQKS